jgi:hypothetical protein
MFLKKFGLIASIIFISILMVSCNVKEISGNFDGELFKISPRKNVKFSWSYYLYVPNSIKQGKKTHILVRPNNTGYPDNDIKVHDKQAEGKIKGLISWAEKLRTPVLVPVFPRYDKHVLIYTHALDRDSLMTDVKGLERIDLQLIAMIGDAKERLKKKGIIVDEKILMCGFSASATFANRFIALHPKRVKAATIGSPGGWPILPKSEWKGNKLKYPVGVGDLNKLVGNEFNLKAFREVSLYFFMGDEDDDDSVLYDDAYGDENRNLILNNFGKDLIKRWKTAESIYEEVNANSKFVIYDGVGHNRTKKMEEDIIEFFLNNMK